MICNLCGSSVNRKMLGVLFSRTGLRLTIRPEDTDTHLCTQCLEGLFQHNVVEILALATMINSPVSDWPDEIDKDARMI